MEEEKPLADIIEKYSKKLESQINTEQHQINYSQEYQRFKAEMVPELSRYERWAQSLGNILTLRITEKDKIRIQNQLNTAHLEVTPSQALTLSLIATLAIFFITIGIAAAYYIIAFPTGLDSLSNSELSNLFLFVFLGIITSLFVFYYTYTMPKRRANAWRLHASSQMVPAVLYVVVYMKHTSNLERAIAFAAQHLEGPLALDFKKIFYDIEIGKYSTIKQSLEYYLENWREDAPEFIESFHLIESSLFEPSEQRRVEILERSLHIILEGVYEKMLKYSREIRTPLTNLYMLGIILPTLGLALLPLASTLLGGIIRWPHVVIFFNVIIPFFVFYMITEVLLKRPGGYGELSTLELNPDYALYKSKRPWFKATLLALPFLILGLLPFIFQWNALTSSLGLKSDYTFSELNIPLFSEIKLFDFKISESTTGPFGPLALILSLFIPLSITIFFTKVYKEKTKVLIKARENTKKLEGEFTNSLFQLGNRIGDGIPAEIAFARVAQSTTGQTTSEFFALVNQNIQQNGMSLEAAIFDKKRGALIFYPSPLIATSMKILVESVKKGLQIAARSLMSISEYVKNIERINQRLRDLLAEVVSDMRSNMTFLAPLLAGIVIGLAAMITFILNKLQALQVAAGAESESLAGFGNLQNIISIFDVTTMIPPYFLQLAVSIYIIEIVFILTKALVTVDAGKDPLREKYDLSRNLRTGIFLYLATAFVTILALSILASIALGSLGT